MPKIKKVIFHPAIFIPTLLVGFLVTAMLAKLLVWPTIKKHQAKGYKEEAILLNEKESFRNAFTLIQKSILKNPEDVETYKVALQTVENSPDYFPYIPVFLKKLTELEPDNPEHFLKYILLSIRIGDMKSAQIAFDSYPESAKSTDEYHQLGYSLGLGLKNSELADYHLEKLLESNPDDEELLYSLSTLRIQTSEDPEKISKAENTLKELAKAESSRVPALRILLTHSLVRNDVEKIREIASQLRQIEELSIKDDLLLLQVEKVLEEDTFEEKVARLLERETEEPQDVDLTLEFLIKHQQLESALHWIDNLTTEVTQGENTKKLVSRVYYLTENWERLTAFISDTDWGNQEYARLLLLALTSRSQNDEIKFRDYWKRCLIEIGTDVENLNVLLDSTISWNWDSETVEVLEALFREEPANDKTYNVLVQYFMDNGESSKALEIMERRVQYLPEDLESKNNFALLSLLRGVNDTKAFIHAKDNFAKDGENPYFLTTWAFALQTQGRHTEAINIVNALKPSDLNDPQRSVYLAKIFFGYGDKDKAKEILSRVDESAMFTEEKNLLMSLKRDLQEERK